MANTLKKEEQALQALGNWNASKSEENLIDLIDVARNPKDLSIESLIAINTVLVGELVEDRTIDTAEEMIDVIQTSLRDVFFKHAENADSPNKNLIDDFLSKMSNVSFEVGLDFYPVFDDLLDYAINRKDYEMAERIAGTIFEVINYEGCPDDWDIYIQSKCFPFLDDADDLFKPEAMLKSFEITKDDNFLKSLASRIALYSTEFKNDSSVWANSCEKGLVICIETLVGQNDFYTASLICASALKHLNIKETNTAIALMKFYLESSPYADMSDFKKTYQPPFLKGEALKYLKSEMAKENPRAEELSKLLMSKADAKRLKSIAKRSVQESSAQPKKSRKRSKGTKKTFLSKIAKSFGYPLKKNKRFSPKAKNSSLIEESDSMAGCYAFIAAIVILIIAIILIFIFWDKLPSLVHQIIKWTGIGIGVVLVLWYMKENPPKEW